MFPESLRRFATSLLDPSEPNESQLRQIILLEYWLRAREKRLRRAESLLA